MPPNSSQSSTFLVLNEYNILDQLHLASMYDNDDVVYQDEEGKFHEVIVEYKDLIDKYGLEINGLDMGTYDTKGEVIDHINLCLGVSKS